MKLTSDMTGLDMLRRMKAGAGVLWVNHDTRSAAFNENKGYADIVSYNEAIIARGDPEVDILWSVARVKPMPGGHSNAEELLGINA